MDTTGTAEVELSSETSLSVSVSSISDYEGDVQHETEKVISERPFTLKKTIWS